jgi:hypothetical protein
MHTIKIVLGGYLLLAVSVLLARWITGPLPASIIVAAKCFLLLWAAITLANMWYGVSHAGYSIKDEAPVALAVYIVPALAAALIWWRSAQA